MDQRKRTEFNHRGSAEGYILVLSALCEDLRVLCGYQIFALWFLNRRWLQGWRSRRFLLFLFRLVRRKILFIDVNNFHFCAELAIAAEQNIISRLLGLAAIARRQLNDCPRRQKMRLLIDRHPVVIYGLARGGERE